MEVYSLEKITDNVKVECVAAVVRYTNYINEDKRSHCEIVSSQIDALRSQLGIFIVECWNSEAALIIDSCKDHLQELFNRKYVYPHSVSSRPSGDGLTNWEINGSGESL